MSIRLEKIDFNHNDHSVSTDGLNIRVDRNIPVPPWLAGQGASAAAYVLAQTDPLNPITIKATFSFTDLANPPPGGLVHVRGRLVAGRPNVLGAIGSTSVPFPAVGASARVEVDLPLTGATIWTNGIGRYDVSWIWEARWSANGVWTFIAQSDHIIYVTLDLPGLPWSQATDVQHAPVWPWTRALDVACVWADSVTIAGSDLDGAATKAAKRIEQHLYELGNRAMPPLTYDVIAVYAMSDANGITLFALSDFLTLVEGTLAPGRGPHVNCTDMAAALTVLANVLGCRLVPKRVQRDELFVHFETNPIVPVGGDSGQPKRKQFSYHDITERAANAGAADRVHDACLMIDRDSDPTSSTSANYKLSKGLGLGVFASASPLRYVHRLISPASRIHCNSHDLGLPSLDEPVGTESAPPPILLLWNQFKNKIDELSPRIGTDSARPAGDLSPINLEGFYAYDRIENPPHLAVLKGLVTASAEFYYVATRKVSRKAPKRDEGLTISIGYAPTARQGRDALAWTLTQTAAPPPPILDKGTKVGEAGFGAGRHRSAYVVRGRALARIISTGRDPVPLLPIARIVDEALKRRTGEALRPRH